MESPPVSSLADSLLLINPSTLLIDPSMFVINMSMSLFDLIELIGLPVFVIDISTLCGSLNASIIDV
ncbi:MULTISPECIES: hypothetical protein [unclassified Actinobaculum]|uniref:hypothetical protein n=1 Tax=unclassified Actinobaculum TaxID=2609299 RepID=UPI000F743CBD|nr:MULTISPECIES: hypothetical protein [unclassified Actinobaculum]RTE50166.1 hypothetical protein EKN07_02805 [Actinobaculum sp. 352]